MEEKIFEMFQSSKEILMKNLMLVVFMGLVLCPVPGYGKLCPDPGCDDPVSQEVRKVAEQMEEQYRQMGQETIHRDQAWLDTCLDGINFFRGLSFTLELPGLDNIMNKVCQAATDEVNRRLAELKGKYTYSALGGLVNAGAGPSHDSGISSSVKVKDVSGMVVSGLRDKINSALIR